jgi:retinoid hydroxylase
VRRGPHPPPPGSLGLPFLGETVRFLRDPFVFTMSRTRQHGTVWKTRILGDTVVFFAGPDAFSLFADPDNFARQGASPKAFENLLHRDAVIFLDDDRHELRKHLLLAAFTEEALDSYLPGVFAVFQRFADGWSGQGEHAVGRELPQVGFDVADHLFAATDPDTSDREHADDLASFLEGALAPPVDLPFTAYGKAVRARDRLREHLAARIAEADGERAGTVLGAVSAARGPAGEQLTPAELEIELFHFYFAAHAGLTAALAWLLVVVGERPDLGGRIRDEADAVLGDGTPTVARVRKLPLARAVSREVLRAYPIVPFTLFGVAKRDLEVDGYRIEAGWKGAGAIWATLQDGSTFADPGTFRADRLGDESFGALPANAYVAQGAGAHRCAGEALVQLLMPAFLGWFVKHYDWEYPEQDASPSGQGVGPLPRSGVRGTVTPRN